MKKIVLACSVIFQTFCLQLQADDCQDCTKEEQRKFDLIKMQHETEVYKAILENVRDLGENKAAALAIIPEDRSVIRNAVSAIDDVEEAPKKPVTKRKKIVKKKPSTVNWKEVQVLYAQSADRARNIKGNIVLRADGKDHQLVQGEGFSISGKNYVLKNISQIKGNDGLTTFDVALANSGGRVVKNLKWK